MAFELLNAMDAGVVTDHTSEHDLESTAYVLGYTVLRRLVNTSGCPSSLEQVIEKCFGGMTLQRIIAQRASAQPLNWHYEFDHDQERALFITEHVSTPLGRVPARLDTTLIKARLTKKPKRFTQVFKVSTSHSSIAVLVKPLQE